jgi:glyoxylase-like metal-dependent hydrolase (beta-lactamase superfamily II)
MPLTITRRIGDADVTILTDGATEFGPDLFPGTDPARIDALLRAAGAGAIATNFNAVLIRTSGRVVLADAGVRELFGPAAGRLPEALAEVGVSAAQIDTLFATHMHPDHIAGMITPQGAAAFPNAELVLTQAEHAFWSDPARSDAASGSMAQWAALAQAVLVAYADRLRLIPDDGEVAPGLTAVPLPGHTPGHGGWRLDGGLVHVGDIVHAPALQIPDPEIAVVFDIDGHEARATRKRLLDMLAADGLMFTGGHFLHPAFHRLERAGQGYRLAQP